MTDLRERLRILRAAIATFACVYTALRLRELWAIAHLPAAQFEPTGLARFVMPPAVVMVIAIATVLLLGAFAAGRRARIVGPLAALGFVLVFSYRSAWGQIFHTENLVALHRSSLRLIAHGVRVKSTLHVVPDRPAAKVGAARN